MRPALQQLHVTGGHRGIDGDAAAAEHRALAFARSAERKQHGRTVGPGGERLRNRAGVAATAVVFPPVAGARIKITQRELDNEGTVAAAIFHATVQLLFHGDANHLKSLYPGPFASDTAWLRLNP